MIRPDDHELYQQLLNLVVESIASESELREFEALLLATPELKRDFVARLAEQSAMSLWDFQSLRLSAIEQGAGSGFSAPSRATLFMSAAIAIALTALVSVVWLGRDTSFAQIVETQNCEWGETSFPTVTNQRLSAGIMRLKTGIALLSFDHGATVNLEGPAVLEIVGPASCRLLSGRAYSEVSPGGEGFVIETPTAVFTDRGTVFGLSVSEDGGTTLSVFKGQVDVDHRVSGEQYSAYTNEVILASESTLQKIQDVAVATDTSEIVPVDEVPPMKKSVCLSTAVGRGADAFVQPFHNRSPHFPAPPNTLLLKREPDHIWNRRIYLRFDLSLADKAEIEETELQLHGVNTAMGYLSQVSDTTVSVFGLTNEAQDFWSEDAIKWEDSPASIGKKVDVDPVQTTLLGEFTISPSRATGLFSLTDSRLTEFLKNDSNGVVTLILTCGPISTARPGYAYGFASKSHPSEPAPALRLTLSGQNTE